MIAYNELIRAFMQEIAELQRNCAAFCNFIVAHLSAFSMDQCREKAEFKFALNENDPLLLFRAISQIHLMGADAPNAAAQLSELLALFFNIKMGMRDDLYTYHMEFSTLRAQIEEVQYAKLMANALTVASSVNPPISVAPVPKALAAIDEELAMSTFVKGLVDPQFRDFKYEYMGRLAQNIRPFISVAQLFDNVVTWSETRQIRFRVNQAAFLTSKNASKSKSVKLAQKDASFAETDTRIDLPANVPPPPNLPYGWCRRCLKKTSDHNSITCPHPTHPQAHLYAKPKRESRLQSKRGESLDEFGYEDGCDAEEVMGNAFGAFEVDTDDDHYLLFDNGANVTICHPQHLTQVRKLQKPVYVRGLGGSKLKIEQEGILFGHIPAYASSKAGVNIISMHQLEQLFPMLWKPNECFIVSLPNGDLNLKEF